MKKYTVEYISYAGNLKRTFVEADDDATEGDIINKAYDSEVGYSSDDIFKIIGFQINACSTQYNLYTIN